MNESQNQLKRRHSRTIHVGNVPIGGNSPISLQSMTNTKTEDAEATLAQIQSIKDAGADLVRVSVPTKEASESFKDIKKRSPLPVIADIHFDYELGLRSAEAGADCLRINPGNIGSEAKVDELVSACRFHNIPIRIGINAGSLEKSLLERYGEPCSDAMVESALKQANFLEKRGFLDYKISLKASSVRMMVEAYEKISTQTEAPLHLGVTEAGTLQDGTIKSAMGLGALLLKGIGDTIRVSLAEEPSQEIKVGNSILRGLGLSQKGISLVVCPSCSRQQFDVIQTANLLEKELANIQTPMKVSVIGCIVNGPGEAKLSDIGLTGGSPNHLLYFRGKVIGKIPQQSTPKELSKILLERILEAKESVIASSHTTNPPLR